ncbi:hypothetical protein ABZ137_01575 [Streptomyces bobili]|uniref:hypothetical protein n=1 Tax=Streptomyces bobili TaxID=67280 RepID=UPI0033A3CDEC
MKNQRNYGTYALAAALVVVAALAVGAAAAEDAAWGAVGRSPLLVRAAADEWWLHAPADYWAWH